MKTSKLLFAATLLGVSISCTEEGADVPGDSSGAIRNVLLISLDTLRADHLGCYGHEFIQSPAIDALARDGVLFTNCISAAPTTLASHTSLFTGTYPHTHGVPRNGFFVHPDNEMLPEVLGANGFRTVGFVGAAPLDTDVNFHQGFDEYDANFTVTEGLREGIYQRPANEVTDLALDWVSNNGGPEDERFFLFLHYYDVHAPYDFPEPYAGMYSGADETIDTSIDNLKLVRSALNKQGLAKEQGPRAKATEDGFASRVLVGDEATLGDARSMAAEYAAGVTWTDHHLGRLFDGLRERGVFDETLIVITSDHGETLYDHSKPFDHGASVYDSESHIPLIMHFPGGRFSNQRVEAVVSNIDILPTLLSLLEISVPEDVEGIDLSLAFDEQNLERSPVFTEATKPFNLPLFNSDPVWKNQGKFQSIRTERFKYMARFPDKKFRLYDLKSDPREETNLLVKGRKFDEEIRVELDGALRYWRESAAPFGGEMTTSKDQLDALNALGYAGDDE